MKLTTKGRFAVTATLDIALNQQNGPVTLLSVSERQSISLSYLEQLFSKLRKKGVVDSIRGPGGGYKITRPYADISIKEIISAVDEQVDATQCNGRGDCHDGNQCITHNLWISVNIKVLDYLGGLTLQDAIHSHNEKQNLHKSVEFFHKKSKTGVVVPS
ncbi:MAG: Rrf2 family transcriptional regulator [Nitrosomonadales bacterium]|jgi:Rrf2 family iron-sulfur cluster assembly transcriptional regulator